MIDVLLIEDDAAVVQSIRLMLEPDAFVIEVADLGQEGLRLAMGHAYRIIVLDLNLPDMSGYEVLASLRSAQVNTPVLILSGSTGTEHKVKGLRFGADDYLTKPFHKDELIARLHAVARRSNGYAQSVVTVGDLVINLDANTVEIAGKGVHLTRKEYRLLELLVLKKEGPVSKESIMSQIYGGIDEPGAKIIDVFVSKLRKKLAQASEGKNYIQTIWGRGYMLRAPRE